MYRIFYSLAFLFVMCSLSVSQIMTHPRIFVTNTQFLKERAATSHQAIYFDLKKRVDSKLTANVASYQDEELIELALCVLVENKSIYGDRVEEVLQYASTNWNEPVGSDEGTIVSMAVALAYDWAYKYIDKHRAAIEHYLENRLINGFTKLLRYAPSYKSEERWYEMSLIAMAIRDEKINDKLCKKALFEFKKWHNSYLKQINDTGKDGMLYYGGSYKLQTIQHNAIFVAARESSEGEVLNYEYLNNVARAMVHESKPKTLNQKFGDSNLEAFLYQGRRLRKYLPFYAQRSNDKSGNYFFEMMHTYGGTMPRSWNAMLWYDIELGSVPPDKSSYYMPDIGIVFMRDYFDLSPFPENLWLKFIAQYYGDYTHFHNNNGHISLNRGLDPLLIESGWYYYGGDHYYKYFRKNVAHNTVIIDEKDHRGIAEFDREADPKSPKNDFGHMAGYNDVKGNYTFASADLTGMHQPEDIDYHTRNVVMVKNKFIIVHDRIRTKNPGNMEKILWHPMTEPDADGSGWTSAGISISDNSEMFSFTSGGSICYVRTLYPAVKHRKIWGRGFEWMDAALISNHTSRQTSSWDYEIADGRVEVFPASNKQLDNYITLIQAGSLSLTEEMIPVRETKDYLEIIINNDIIKLGKSAADNNFEFTAGIQK